MVESLVVLGLISVCLGPLAAIFCYQKKQEVLYQIESTRLLDMVLKLKKEQRQFFQVQKDKINQLEVEIDSCKMFTPRRDDSLNLANSFLEKVEL